MELTNDELKIVLGWAKDSKNPLVLRIREAIASTNLWVCENAETCRKVQIECCHSIPHAHVSMCDEGCARIPGVKGSECRPVVKPVELRVCENADRCDMVTCRHRVPHSDPGECDVPCMIGVEGSMCRPVEEQLICENADRCDIETCRHRIPHRDVDGECSTQPCVIGGEESWCRPVEESAKQCSPTPKDQRSEPQCVPAKPARRMICSSASRCATGSTCPHGMPHDTHLECSIRCFVAGLPSECVPV